MQELEVMLVRGHFGKAKQSSRASSTNFTDAKLMLALLKSRSGRECGLCGRGQSPEHASGGDGESGER